VVGMLDVPRLLRGARFQQGLHLVEQCRVDEWFMRSGVQGSFVADHSGVVGVGEQFVEGVLPQRLGRAFRGGNGDQAACGEVA